MTLGGNVGVRGDPVGADLAAFGIFLSDFRPVPPR
jgi:hypothetical protein